MEKKRYEIQYVARRTGLTAHRIRAWERRYQAVSPDRTSSRRRIYSEADIRRLQLLRRAVENGHRISEVGRMALDRLMKLVNRHAAADGRTSSTAPTAGSTREIDAVNAAFRAIVEMNPQDLKAVLTRSMVTFPRRRLIEGVVVPLLARVGDAWVKGRLGIANEHLASAVVRSFLGSLLQEAEPAPEGPGIVVATLSGQHHELGAMTVALSAADAGWRPLYLGSNLPAEEIAATVEQTAASAAAVSVSSTSTRGQLVREINKLWRLLEGRAALFAGGRAGSAFRSLLNDIAIRWCDTLEAFHFALLEEELHDRDLKT